MKQKNSPAVRSSGVRWHRLAGLLTLLSGNLLLTACQSVLPSEKASHESPWTTFDDAKQAYDLVLPNYTTVDELREVGFDPYTVPNVGILTYLDIIQRFIPNTSIKIDDLDEGIQRCIKAREACYAYEATPSRTKKKRYGNAAADMMGFRKRERIEGWTFNALIVIIDELVVYKIWGGVPNFVENKQKKNPLGPLQGDAIRDLIK